jgi:hypothetical protein
MELLILALVISTTAIAAVGCGLLKLSKRGIALLFVTLGLTSYWSAEVSLGHIGWWRDSYASFTRRLNGVPLGIGGDERAVSPPSSLGPVTLVVSQ